MNDSLSKGVFKLFIQKLNETYWFFLKSDMEEFEKDQFALDDYIQNGNCDFIDKYVTTYSRRMEEAKKYVIDLKGSHPDYSGRDSVTFGDPNFQKSFKDTSEAKDSWKRRIAYDVLVKITEQDSVFARMEMQLDSLVTTTLPGVIENQLCLFQELQNKRGGIELFVKEAFLNALANFQDPNTSFFSPNDKDNFESSLSTNQLTFGVYPDKNEKGEIEVLYVAPGSVAHKNGSIEESDIIKEMYSISLGQQFDTHCISVDEIYSFLNDNNNETVLFKIKKKDGDFEHIELTKGVLKSPENLTRGYVIKKDIPMGYINIPSFYTDMESPNGQGVANDVIKEIFKLEKAQIEGLILDLRFNGGGSIREAIELCGMFIDQGPVAIFKSGNNSMELFNDYHKGMLFSKPMVIIINGYSASASEFFTATLQDYRRAIVVGAESYGKSSSQVVLPLSDYKDMGYCKVTTNCFYRINGASNQSVGVMPDIAFPSVYNGLETAEKYLDFVLENDTLAETPVFKPLMIQDYDKIMDRSNLRVAESTSFQFIEKINTTVREGYFGEDRSFPLTLNHVYTDLSDYQGIWSRFEQHFYTKRTEITASNSPSVDELLTYNPEEKELNELMLEGISEDIYIEEAYRILLDLIGIYKK